MQPTPAKSILSSLSSSRRSRLLHGAAPAPSETMTTSATSGADNGGAATVPGKKLQEYDL